MRWEDMRESENVEERSGGPGIGFGGPLRLGGGAIIVIIVISLLFGKNPLDVLALLSGGGAPSVQTESVQPPVPRPGPHQPPDPQREFVARVLGDTEDVWDGIFRQLGSRYQRPKLVLFHGQVASACGLSSAAVGPFYCPGDRDVYLDLSFFQELSQRFGAPGDFARAYVIAHEVGHHVQNQLGLMDEVQRRVAGAPERVRNQLSVRQELQADCLAGVWGHSAAKRGLIDQRDVEQGIAAAMAVGDDRLQQRARGYVVPEQFTHGSSEQRARWFRIGLESGDIRQCDTFASREARAPGSR
ncbi:MAG TPA: neutral zinc metallopeptidase [Casimicrobiaceae bacterium]|nr:neutral zinc metallopeptidase [Casimicrobiaceae bacterium]